MKLTAIQLSNAIGCKINIASVWLDPINETLTRFGIDTINEVASFLAQVGHESGGFSHMVENLNYSATGLAATWPTRYQVKTTGKPNAMAIALNRKPIAIANDTYANRMGNGDVASGDGWKYRGRGLIQITGKNNYINCGQYLGIDLFNRPELLEQPKYAALSAGWFWHVNGLDKLDDDLSVLAETKKINGGTNGLADREKRMRMALNALKG
jgi:putative chitinase